jgi:hypothetical protein
MKMKQIVALASLLALSAGAANAEGLGFTFEADLEYGGDDLATVNFTDGSSQHVKAGQGVTLALGGHYRASEASPYSVRATVGYKFVTTAAENADIGVERTVFEVVGNHLWPSGFWLGGGLTHHSGVRFKGDGFGPDVDFDDATGLTAEFGWKWIALSYTKIDYKDEFGGKWDGSSLGLTLTSKF